MRVAVYAASKELYKVMRGPIKSMVKNGKPDKVYLLLEHDEYIEELPPIFEVINVSGQRWFVNGVSPNFQSKYTYMSLMRVVLTKLLPENIDKVLSLDVDTIVKDDISELWDMDIDDYYLSASIEPGRTNAEKQYFNTGVALYNLKKIREDAIDDTLVWDLNHHKYPNIDQDAINKICAGKIKPMPPEYNYNDYVERPKVPEKIRHFAGFHVSAWGVNPDVYNYASMPWSDVLN